MKITRITFLQDTSSKYGALIAKKLSKLVMVQGASPKTSAEQEPL